MRGYQFKRFDGMHCCNVYNTMEEVQEAIRQEVRRLRQGFICKRRAQSFDEEHTFYTDKDFSIIELD